MMSFQYLNIGHKKMESMQRWKSIVQLFVAHENPCVNTHKFSECLIEMNVNFFKINNCYWTWKKVKSDKLWLSLILNFQGHSFTFVISSRETSSGAVEYSFLLLMPSSFLKKLKWRNGFQESFLFTFNK